MSVFGYKNLLVILFSLCVIAPNVMLYYNRVSAESSGLETTAVVGSINSGTRGLYPRAYVNYTVDGKKYHRDILVRYKQVKPGDEVLIYYNAYNPKKATLKNRQDAADNTRDLVVYSIGGILVFVIYMYIGCKNVLKAKLNGARHMNGL